MATPPADHPVGQPPVAAEPIDSQLVDPSAVDSPLVDYATDLGQHLVALMRSFTRVRTQMAASAPETVDLGAMTLLFRLIHDGPQRASILAEVTCADPSTVSRQVAHLVKIGLIERQADPEDGRASLLVPTEAGRAVFGEFARWRGRILAPLVADWTADDREDFARLVEKFTNALEGARTTMIADASRAPLRGEN